MEGKKNILLIVACAAVLVMAIAFVAEKGIQTTPNLSTSMSADPSADANTNLSSPLVSTMSSHTLFSVVLILGMAAVGLLILGWGEPRQRPPIR